MPYQVDPWITRQDFGEALDLDCWRNFRRISSTVTVCT
jgi:hypothetical protein